MFEQPWTGVFPAILCPFGADEAIDEAGLAAYAREIAFPINYVSDGQSPG
jgi:dihydrodipicolinate synthase/N-acetylneuraminate lyase